MAASKPTMEQWNFLIIRANSSLSCNSGMYPHVQWPLPCHDGEITVNTRKEINLVFSFKLCSVHETTRLFRTLKWVSAPLLILT